MLRSQLSFMFVLNSKTLYTICRFNSSPNWIPNLSLCAYVHSSTTGHAAEYTINTYGSYGQMFVKLLSDPGEIWDEIFVVEGKFPSEEELEKYDGFVITGSRHDAHGDEDWIERLCTVLQRIHEKRKKLLGVCFGHQVWMTCFQLFDEHIVKFLSVMSCWA